MSSTNHVSGAVSVSTKAAITVDYTEPIAKGSTFTSITVKKGTTKVSYRAMVSGNRLSITSASSWPRNSVLTVTVPAGAIKDAAGNATTTATTFSFTTGS